MRLKDRVAIVTGRRVGLDRRTASPWRARVPTLSPRISCRARRPWRKSSRLVARRNGGRRVAQSTQAMAAQTVQHFGRIDILVNNAATRRPGSPPLSSSQRPNGIRSWRSTSRASGCAVKPSYRS